MRTFVNWLVFGAFSSYSSKCIPEIFQVAQAENPKSQTPQMFIVRVPCDSVCNSAVSAIKTERALEEFPPKQVTLSSGQMSTACSSERKSSPSSCLLVTRRRIWTDRAA